MVGFGTGGRKSKSQLISEMHLLRLVGVAVLCGCCVVSMTNWTNSLLMDTLVFYNTVSGFHIVCQSTIYFRDRAFLTYRLTVSIYLGVQTGNTHERILGSTFVFLGFFLLPSRSLSPFSFLSPSCLSLFYSYFLLQRKRRESGSVEGVFLLFRMNRRLLESGCQIMTPLALPWHVLLETSA